MTGLGKALMLLGAVMFVLGGLLALSAKLPWLGRLPGDIVIERGNFRFYFPLATCVLLSLLLSALFWFLRR
jgi:hypothetical protein